VLRERSSAPASSASGHRLVEAGDDDADAHASPRLGGLEWCAARAASASGLEPGQQVAELRLLRAQVSMLPACGADSRAACARRPWMPYASRPADLLRVVRGAAHAADAEVAQDLRADAVVAQVLAEAELQVRLDGVAARSGSA
jgi:hypothetical protein